MSGCLILQHPTIYLTIFNHALETCFEGHISLVPNKRVIDIRRLLEITLYTYIYTYINYIYNIYACIYKFKCTSNTPHILCFGEEFFRLTCIPGDRMWDAYSLDTATSSETTGELGLYFRAALMEGCWYVKVVVIFCFHQKFLARYCCWKNSWLITWDVLSL